MFFNNLNTMHQIVMVIDDNPIDRFVVERIVLNLQYAKEVLSQDGARSAMEYLTENQNNLDKIPSIILLDINMPEIDGFGFLDMFEGLNDDIKAHCKIVMLTSSMNDKDYNRAFSYKSVINFLHKPLSEEKLKEIK